MIGKLNYILDPIHGNISITSLEQKIIESTLFNRLNYITQLSTVFFVHPSANHVRSAHSIGVMYIASKYFINAINNSSETVKNKFLINFQSDIEEIIKDNTIQGKKKRYDSDDSILSLDISMLSGELRNFNFKLEQMTHEETHIFYILLQAVRVSALLHDIGHLPFSHLSETSLETIYNLIRDKDKTKIEEEYCKAYDDYVVTSDDKLHEILGNRIIDLLFEEIFRTIKDENQKLYVKLIQSLAKNITQETNENFKILHKIVSSMVDSDRLDYITRDSLNIGAKTLSYDIEKILLNAVLIDNRDELILGLKVDAISEVEHFLQSRFHLYNSFLFSASSVKKYQILNQILIRESVQFLKDGSNEMTHDYKLPLDISGLWLPLLILGCEDCEDYDLIDMLFQYDESWLLYILKMKYFELERRFYHEHHFDNKPRTRKHFYGLREILFGENLFHPLWENKNGFASFFGIEIEKIPNLTKSFFLPKNHKKLVHFFKDIVNKYSTLDIIFSIRKFDNGYKKDFIFIDSEGTIKIEDVSPIESIMRLMVFNEAPFYFYVRDDQDQLMQKELFQKDLQQGFNELINPKTQGVQSCVAQ